MKYLVAASLTLIGIATPAMADLTLTNGAVIRFSDNTTMSTAAGMAAPADHGGFQSFATGTLSFIGGGLSNGAWDDYGTVGGGESNQAGTGGSGPLDARWATVTGGYSNEASGAASTVGGGWSNAASGGRAFVGGGENNAASGLESTVGGGSLNTASGLLSTVGGGSENVASGASSTIAGGGSPSGFFGYGNTASGISSTIGGGSMNTAIGDFSTVVGGGQFLIFGQPNTAGGDFSTVAGGAGNTADGEFSFVAGWSANDSGYANSFVWGGATGSGTSAGADTFNVWSAGGIYLNGTVHAASDRNIKEAFSFVSAREVLDKVVDMPVTTWRFKSEDDSIRHIGPMAQDFMAAFGFGKSDKHIASTDADGVALAAIQGLYEMQQEKDAKLAEQAEINTALRWQNAQLKAMLHARDASLEARFAKIEEAILRERQPELTQTD